jgi:hypothetical protein
MVNYNNGKIYKIVDFSNNNFYVGSTAQPKLCSRLGEHVSKFGGYMRGTNPKYCASMEILINENYKIFLLEIYPCNSKEELNMKEQEHIDKLRCDKMVNKQNPYVSKEDMLIKKQKYREDHKEEIKKQKQIYRQEHKEEIKIKKQIYNQEHKEEIKIRKQIYHEEHKEEINAKRRGKSPEEKEVINQQQKERRKKNPEKYIEYDRKRSAKRSEKNREKVECPNCKSIVGRSSIARHKKSPKCLDFVEK